jgi:putative ABC transport system ATP-binding protein
MNDITLKMKDISRVFSAEEMDTYALRDINLEICRGDFVSIAGPSGCGKSTLLSILGLLDAPTTGTYAIEGADVSRLSLSEAAYMRNEKFGFIFQSFNLIDEISVFDNVALPLRYRRNKVPDMEQRVTQCLQKVNMLHRIRHKPNQLSGGQQQRVAIARALAGNPLVLLADEPTGNLDSRTGDAVMDVLAQLNSEGMTICMVTHEVRYADMANRKLHLLDGRMIDAQAVIREEVTA